MSQNPLDLNPALAARYANAQAALPTPPAGANTAVLQHLLAHRSVRAYLPDALPDGTLAHLVAAAQSAPTSSNLQAWSVLAVTDPERKARLSEWSRDQAHIRQAPLFLVWLADLSRLDRVAQGLGLTSDANQYLEQFLVASIDASLAAQNAVVAAEALGLGGGGEHGGERKSSQAEFHAGGRAPEEPGIVCAAETATVGHGGGERRKVV